jgi:hypothetical protein
MGCMAAGQTGEATDLGFWRTTKLVLTDSHFLLPLAVLVAGLVLLFKLRA